MRAAAVCDAVCDAECCAEGRGDRLASTLVRPLLSTIVGALSVCALGACAKGTELKAPAIGAAAPAYAAHALSDTAVTLAALRGKVVVLNVWATWCQPCREELPLLEALHRQHPDVEMVGVSVDAAGMGMDVQDFAKEHDLTYTIWLDPDREFSLKFLSVGVPETFVIDRLGVIRWRHIGALARNDTTLAGAVQRALGE